jgi:hypothetical protein
LGENTDCCSEVKVAMDRSIKSQDDLKAHEKGNREDFAGVWSAIDGIRNRPPVWATVVMTLLAAAVGWFAKG